MKIIREQVFPGPNLHAHRPVIALELDLGPWQGKETSQLPGFAAKLAALLPSLESHHCALGREGGFLERVEEGTYLGHVVEHLALELSTLAGEEVFFGTTRQIKGSRYRVVYEYLTPEVGLLAGRTALELTSALAKGEEAQELLAKSLEKLRTVFRDYAPGPSTKALLASAKERRIPTLPLVDGALQLGYGKNAHRIAASLTSQAGALAVDLACDKWATRELLQNAGLPVPKGKLAASWEAVLEAIGELGFPLVIKPACGNQGKGVTVGIETVQEAKVAWEDAKAWGEVLVEEEIKGQDYRLLVVGEKLVAASLRLPPQVIGDGKSTIEELVAEVNEDKRRGEGHELPLTKIKIDDLAKRFLARQGYHPSSIPSHGAKVYLRGSGNLSTGGTAIDVTEEVHPQLERMALRAVRLLGLDVAGVDLLCPSIDSPGGCAIVEVNVAPGLRMHLHPSKGKARPVATEIIGELFPQGDGRIPLVAVTGTNGKTTTVRMLGHVMAGQGLFVGMTTTDGIYLDGELAVPGDNTGPWSSGVVLRDPKVEAAVLEVARGGVIRGGLGYDLAQVAVVTNLSDDHLGVDGIGTLNELAEVKSLVAECVLPGGWVVLNADDPLVFQMAKRVPKDVKILYFGTKCGQKLKRYLKNGGAALYLEGDRLIWSPGSLQGGKFRASIADYPATLAGELTHNTANLLAAIAAALALGLKPEVIEEALLAFSSDPVCNPGRFNIFEFAGRKVIVDYGHNPAGFTTTLIAGKKLGSDLIGVIGAPGDRRDETIFKMGQLAGDYCQQLIIKEDQDLRGRCRGEVAGLLRAGAISAGMDPGKIRMVFDEVEALQVAIREYLFGDVLIFYESWARVHKELTVLMAENLATAAAPLQLAAGIKRK